MGIYSDLGDAELDEKIVELRDAYEKTVGGQVAVISGNGRRMEYTRADSKALRSLLRDAQNERAERGGACVAGAIGIVYP